MLVGIDIVYFLCLSFALVSSPRLGASRGFAFVEFNTEEEASRWMEFKQVSGVKATSHENQTKQSYKRMKQKKIEPKPKLPMPNQIDEYPIPQSHSLAKHVINATQLRCTLC